MNKAIEIHGVSHRYGTQCVLNNINLTIEQGQSCIIIGPNGSGKTTLMKLMAGILTATRGHIHVLDRKLREYTRQSLARTVAFVPQNIPETFPFTVTELVLMGRYPHQGLLGLESREDLEIAREAMAFTDVAHLARRKLNQLSGGERQRVFIARAISQSPRIMLLDEPTAALDLAHQVRVMDLMEKLQSEKGITVVMVSHDVNLAAMYADTLLLLKQGCTVGMGKPRDVLDYQTLEKAYGCQLLVDSSPVGDFPRVTLVPGRYIAP